MSQWLDLCEYGKKLRNVSHSTLQSFGNQTMKCTVLDLCYCCRYIQRRKTSAGIKKDVCRNDREIQKRF